MADWTLAEVEAAVADYLSMLALEVSGKPFNKAEHNRNLRTQLNDRSPASVEKKHQNISAVLIELGYPYIDGYKPLSNYQKALLPDVVSEAVSADADLQRKILNVVESIPALETPFANILDIAVPAPLPDPKAVRSIYEKPHPKSVQSKKNYLEIEARNIALGLAGEQMVVRYERERLWRAGAKKLADRVDHVSVSQGDGLGFDILSFESDGRERFIEVKTTQFGALVPFFASRNEVDVSEKNANQYHLYRLHKFLKSPKLFTLPGSLRKTCQLEPVTFLAKVA
jgi:hypothetical protein